MACDCDIICITETWLTEDVLSTELFNSNFNVYRSNGGRRGRGVMIAVKSNIESHNLEILSPVPDHDILAVKVNINCQTIVIINIYISPSSPKEHYELIFEYLEQQCDLSSNTVVLGDFNIPEYVSQISTDNNNIKTMTNQQDLSLKKRKYLAITKKKSCEVKKSKKIVI